MVSLNNVYINFIFREINFVNDKNFIKVLCLQKLIKNNFQFFIDVKVSRF